MNINQFGAADLKRAFLAGTAALNSHKEYVNELNVFPVPDGDTGTNMSMTLNSAAQEVAKLPDEPEMAALCKAISSGTLRGARGNSGVILSQLLRGFCKELRDYQSVDTILLAAAFSRAVDSAYKAVMKPKEGTILTVARSMSESAAENAVTQDDIKLFMEAVIADGHTSLEHTPELLPVLKEAGVVDSGGQGLMYAMEGALAGLLDESFVYDPECAAGISEQAEAQRRAKAEAAAAEEQLKERFRYMAETEVAASLSEAQQSELKACLDRLGVAALCEVSHGSANVRMYTDDPGMVLHELMAYGELTEIKINNLHKDAGSAGSTGADASARSAEETSKNHTAGADISKTDDASEAHDGCDEKKSRPHEHKAFGFVTVAVGEGLEEIFRSLGADVVISGGQTMNPSTDDFLKAIDEIDADEIYLIPNNKNIILAANQAAGMSKTAHVHVVPTTTIPQGITALITFDQSTGADENREAMSEAAGCVKTCEVTYAVRDTSIDGFNIHENDIMAIADGRISAVGRSIDDTVAEAISAMTDDSTELVSLYYGADIRQDEAEALAERITAMLPSADVEVHAGGQPVYFYLISAE